MQTNQQSEPNVVTLWVDKPKGTYAARRFRSVTDCADLFLLGRVIRDLEEGMRDKDNMLDDSEQPIDDILK